MKIAMTCALGLSATGCGGFIDSAAHLATATAHISWPGAFVTVGVVACAAWIVVTFLRS